jgi:hypothetical protein
VFPPVEGLLFLGLLDDIWWLRVVRKDGDFATKVIRWPENPHRRSIHWQSGFCPEMSRKLWKMEGKIG